MSDTTQQLQPTLPPLDPEPPPIDDAPEVWARVEIMGHRTHYGRLTEVHQYGTTLLQIEQPTRQDGVFEVHQYGGSAIFGIRRCTKEQAFKGASQLWPYEPSVTAGPLLTHDEGDLDTDLEPGDQ